MANFIGKIDFNKLIGVKIADIEIDGRTQKYVMVPMTDNDIVQWNDELQLWFRAMAYREPVGRFTHFIMKFIPRKSIQKLSAAQLEAFAAHKIGGMIKSDYKPKDSDIKIETNTFISDNI